MRMRFPLTRSLALLALFMTVVPSSAALAQAPAAPAAPGPAGQVAAATGITRFINEQTVMAGEADLTKLDAAAIEKTLMELGKAAGMFGPNALQTPEAEGKQTLAVGTKWVNDAKQAGATAIYLVMDARGMQRFGPTIIIPVPDAKAPGVAKLIPLPQAGGAGAKPAGTQPAAVPNQNQQQVTTIPGVGVVFGAAANLNAFRAIKPAPRADLMAAFKQAGAAPIRIAFTLDAASRQQLAKQMPPMIMGKPSTLITKDFQWLSVAATPPPNMTIKAVAQSTDANTAKQTDELLVSAIVMNQQSPNKLPDQMVTLLTPQAQGNQLLLSLDGNQLNQLAVAMREPLMRGRQAALRVQSASNIRQMLQGCMLYANENKGKYPPTLQELEKSMAAIMEDAKRMQQVFTNPTKPDVKPGYVYVPPAQGFKATPDTVVIYESHKDFADGINVGFADGHVEFVADKKRFDEMLAKTAQQQ